MMMMMSMRKTPFNNTKINGEEEEKFKHHKRKILYSLKFRVYHQTLNHTCFFLSSSRVSYLYETHTQKRHTTTPKKRL